MDNYISYIINILNFPDNAKKVILKTEKRINKNRYLSRSFYDICRDYMQYDRITIQQAISKIESLAVNYFISQYTLDFMFVLHCSEVTRNNYLKKGYSEDFFLIGAKDFRCKLIECMKRFGIVGTFVADWNDGFLKMQRFTLGRFQYEPEIANFDFKSRCGIEIHKGDELMNMHIPSTGVSLTDDNRYDSYKKAYDFYKDNLQGSPLIIVCHSWLLYPRQEEFLAENSNVLKFMRDFEMVYWREGRELGPSWRLYGKKYPVFILPKRNSLEKAYTQWLQAGNYGGHGTGIIIFDGKGIINKAYL